MKNQLIKEIEVFAKKFWELDEDTVYEFCNGKKVILRSQDNVLKVSKSTNIGYIDRNRCQFSFNTLKLPIEELIILLWWFMNRTINDRDLYVIKNISYFRVRY